jgi:hypothetical protein
MQRMMMQQAAAAPVVWSFVGVNQLTIPATGATQVISIPTCLEGDLIVAVQASEMASVVAPDGGTGWETVYSDNVNVTRAMHYQVAGSTPPTSFNFASPGTSNINRTAMIVTVWRGVNNTVLDSTIPTEATATSTVLAAPTETTTTDDALIITTGHLDAWATVSGFPANTDASWRWQEEGGVSANGTHLGVAAYVAGAAGSKSPGDWTFSVSNVIYTNTVAFRKA